MYEYCNECPNIRQLLRQYTEDWMNRIKWFYYKKYCKIRGHKFITRKWMDFKYNGEEIYREICRCGFSRYKFYSTGKVLSEEEASDYSGMIIYELVNSSVNIYKLLPKELWKDSSA